jgi:hypothetical protein
MAGDVAGIVIIADYLFFLFWNMGTLGGQLLDRVKEVSVMFVKAGIHRISRPFRIPARAETTRSKVRINHCPVQVKSMPEKVR